MEWVYGILSGLIGGAFVAGVNWATMRADMRSNKRRISSVESRVFSMDEDYVTRREFNVLMRGMRDDIREMNASVGAIRDVLLSELDVNRKDLT